jgi:hypothetical protein
MKPGLKYRDTDGDTFDEIFSSEKQNELIPVERPKTGKL